MASRVRTVRGGRNKHRENALKTGNEYLKQALYIELDKTIMELYLNEMFIASPSAHIVHRLPERAGCRIWARAAPLPVALGSRW